jgi:hypothetical protein
MYHLIVLNLVAESVAGLRSAGWTVPESISEPLKRMLDFTTKIRLSNGTYPLWNDAAYNIANPLDEVVSWGSQLLGQSPNHPTDALCKRLLQAAGVSRMPLLPYQGLTTSSHCPDSGYSILRNATGLELAFDYASPCPDELPPHAHADCLTVDLYCNGQPIIVDTGTSQYAGGEIRSYERSTLAHNTIAIAHQDQSEVWGSFRVGRKAQPFNIESGTSEGWQWISAAHNGYAKPPLNAVHQRCVGLGSQEIVICDRLRQRPKSDRLETAFSTEYTSTLHFAPGLSLVYNPDQDEYCCQLGERRLYIKVFGLEERDRVRWMDADTSQSWYAPEFGRRYPRGCLRIQGLLPPQGKTICTVLTLDASPKVTWEWSNGKGKLQFENGLFLEPS